MLKFIWYEHDHWLFTLTIGWSMYLAWVFDSFWSSRQQLALWDILAFHDIFVLYISWVYHHDYLALELALWLFFKTAKYDWMHSIKMIEAMFLISLLFPFLPYKIHVLDTLVLLSLKPIFIKLHKIFHSRIRLTHNPGFRTLGCVFVLCELCISMGELEEKVEKRRYNSWLKSEGKK